MDLSAIFSKYPLTTVKEVFNSWIKLLINSRSSSFFKTF